jgi:hypothetical protein
MTPSMSAAWVIGHHTPLVICTVQDIRERR